VTMKWKDRLLTVAVSLYLGAGLPFGAAALLFGYVAERPLWQDAVMAIYSTVAWPLLFFGGFGPFPGWWNW
jgi:hypothetical protein